MAHQETVGALEPSVGYALQRAASRCTATCATALAAPDAAVRSGPRAGG